MAVIMLHFMKIVLMVGSDSHLATRDAALNELRTMLRNHLQALAID